MSDSFFTELKRRNVFKVGVAYLVLIWVVIQIADVIVPVLSLPDWTITFLIVVGMFGFPFALFFAWAFEITPEGIKKESEISPEVSITVHTGRKLDFTIIGLLVVAGYFIYESRFESQPTEALVDKGSTTEIITPKEVTEEQEAPSIAVLPFVNMSSDKEQQNFSDGLSEELLNLLAKIPQLRVIARTSSFSFKDKQEDVSSIAKKLNVAYVLEGSVQKSGNTLRITAQLIRSSDSSRIWSETYERELINIFVVQDEIVKAVANVLKITLLPNQNIHTTVVKNIDPVRAKSRRYADKEIALDPDPDPADGYGSSASTSTYTYDFVNALADINKAQQINHGDSQNLSVFGNLLWVSGQYEAAIKALTESLELDPLSTDSMTTLGSAYLSINQFDKAETVLLRALQIVPKDIFAQLGLAKSYLLTDKYDNAIDLYKNQDGMWRMYILTMAYFSKGNVERSDQYLKKLIESSSQTAAYQIASVYAWRGEIDLAFKWIEIAYQQHDSGMSILKADNVLPTTFKNDPRYSVWLEKMGLSD